MKTNHHILKNPALQIINKVLVSDGYSVRIVGGAVRDIIQGNSPKDIDLATSATPDQVISLFSNAGYQVIETGLQHGTVTVIIDHEGYEITTLRSDVSTDGRHAEVQFHTDWKLDASRRDLTINAMSMNIDGEIFDYFNGLDDLKNGRIIFVGNPAQRIQEDYLRILRYFRFSTRLKQEPIFDSSQMDAIQENLEGLKSISVERIWSEMQKIIVAPNAFKTLAAMLSVGVLNTIEMKVSTFQHFNNTKSTNPITMLVALLGKEAVNLTETWKMSVDERKLASFLCGWFKKPMYIKEWQYLIAIKGVSFVWVEELAKLHSFDLHVPEIEVAKNSKFSVNGHDLLDAGFSGPEVGRILNEMKIHWLNSNFTLNKQELLKKYD